MKIGIIGLPQVGKKTLFELLTGEKLSEHFRADTREIKNGMARMVDSRLDKLHSLYPSSQKVPATLEIVLLPKFDKETVSTGEFAKALEKCDALCHVVRAFSDESVFHVEGSVDPLRDIDNVFTELILSDLILIEKRITRMTEERQKGAVNPHQEKEKEIILRMKELLDAHLPLIDFSMSDEEKKIMSTYQFLTRKPMILVLNVDEDKIADDRLVQEMTEKYKDHGVKVMQISAKIEAELSSLEEQERESFLNDLNIKESALHQMGRLYFDALGLITFFTVGDKETRAWTAPKGATAPEAAGSIHTDLQRGFIRADIMKSVELLELGSEAKLKEAGKIMLKGKDYILEDGDVMHVRFNV